MAWAIDLDGVMWLGPRAIPGSAAAVERLREAGEQVLFVTNNSSKPLAEVEAALDAMGVPAEGAVATSAMAAASIVAPGERVFTCAGPGVVEAMTGVGAEVVTDLVEARTGVDAVVVGFTRDFDFEILSAASHAVRAGARLIGTNDDATYPTPEGQVPGGGAILAAVTVASGVQPVVAGKPYDPMVDLVRRRLGSSGIMVGDRPETDGRFAVRLGYRFGLVESGVTAEGAGGIDPPPDVVAGDLAGVVAAELDM